jgi:Uma2 family endonuclease
MSADASTSGAKVTTKLEPGDCLTREEFERRYEAMTECKKAELIEGIVYMPSPVRLERHGEPHAKLIGWLFVYEVATPGARSADNASDRLDLENEPQPDCMMFIDPKCGGQTQISKDDYLVGPPELVAEVSTSSVSYDRGPKLRTFRRHGVKEYLIWRVDDGVFEWNVLRGGDYQLLEPNDEGVLCSESFPGLWLDADALIKGNLEKVLSTLQRGIDTDAHRAFVEQLRQRKT